MSEEFKKLNKKYNDETYPEYPFISKNKVTMLTKGLYRKFEAKYRGITAVFNEEKAIFEFPLYGMYYVTKDIVIVPPECSFNTEKSAILDAALKAGFEQVDGSPTFVPVFFSEDSPEAKLALANKATYYSKNRKPLTI